MKLRLLIPVFLFMTWTVSAQEEVLPQGQVESASETEVVDTGVNVGEMLFGHIGDSYGWHITDWNGKHISIPLPCIVHSSTGWHVFMSSKIEHGHE